MSNIVPLYDKSSKNNLITPAQIPGDFALLEDALGDLLSKIKYDKDTYSESISSDGTVTYKLTIVSKIVEVPLFSSQFKIVLFKDSESTISDIPLELEWHWPLRKYFSDPAKLQGFASMPEDFLSIFLELAKIKNEEEFFDKIADTFWGDASEDFTKFWAAIEATLESYKQNKPGVDTEISNIITQVNNIRKEVTTTWKNNSLKQIYQQYKVNDPNIINIKTAVDSIKTSFTKLKDVLKVDIDVYKSTVPALLKNIKHLNVEEQLDKLFELFEKWIEGIDRHDLHKLLVPQIECTVKDIRADLEFPQGWSTRLKLDSLPGEPEVFIEDQGKRAAVELPIGDLTYSTTKGFTFVNKTDPKINLETKLTYSTVGKTGFVVTGEGFEIDWSRTSNMITVEKYKKDLNKDFIGFYAEQIKVILPPKWFNKIQKNPGNPNNNPPINTLTLYATDLLVGTGGISGTVGLKVNDTKNAPGEDDAMTFVIGKQNASGKLIGFEIVFKKFDLTFKQNKITGHSIKGHIFIPKFNKKIESRSLESFLEKYLPIDMSFSENGDWHIAVNLKSGQKLLLKNIFTLNIKTAEIGRDDEKVYAEISGTIDFSNNIYMDGFLEDPLPIEKFRIYHDGSFELEGGTIPLPESVRLNVKPVEVYVTAIHIGSHKQKHNGIERSYKYFGMDASVSVNPGGMKGEGNGMKYYFTVDDDDDQDNIKPHHHFLRIEGLSIDMTIPGNASASNAALILSGYLNMKEDEYKGNIKFAMPKMKIAGGAAMLYKPGIPAFLVDANLSLPSPLPFGATNLGIYEFRGLFGLRYIADKKDAPNWFEYYKAPPEKGVVVKKFKTPDQTEGSSTPFSIGAGISLATLNDDGKAFSSQLFLLVSIPNLILLEGRANILGPRLKVTDPGEPPFYAMIAYSPGDSVITGAGVNYNIPRDGKTMGSILKLKAEIEAAYFFKNSKGWYVHIGTKSKPITAEILTIFNGYAYLMLNAFGIEAGAGVRFAFEKSYCGKVVRVSAKAYFDVWGRVIFPRSKPDGSEEPTQFGGGIAVGGSMDVSLFGIALYLGFAATLTGEAPRPMRVAGSVELVVAIKLVVKNIEKRFTAEFIWEKLTARDTDAIYPFPLPGEVIKTLPAGAVSLKSGSTYSVQYFYKGEPTEADITTVIPINAAVDLQFGKSVLPNAVSALIGGVVNAAEGYEDLVPPAKGNRQVQHRYSVTAISIKIWENGTWEPYDPYKAMMGSGAPAGKHGYWQKTGDEYNKIRLLAQSPFAYMNQGQPDWYTPEQFDLPAQILLCQKKERAWHCALWDREGKTWKPNQLHPYQELAFLVTANDSMVRQMVKGVRIAQPLALRVEAPGTLELYLPEAAAAAKIHVLESCPYQITVTWIAEIRDTNGNLTGYQTVATETKRNTELPYLFTYNDPKKNISKAIVTPSVGNKARINELETEIRDLNDQILAAPASIDTTELRKKLSLLRGEWLTERGTSCCFAIREQDKSDLAAYIAKVYAEWKLCLEKQKQLDAVVALKCGKGMPNGPCQIAQSAAAKNKALCDQLKRTLDIAESVKGRPIVSGDVITTCCFWVQEVCWLTERDHFYNKSIPGQDEINGEYATIANTAGVILAPVWRPAKKYCVQVSAMDNVDGKDEGKDFWFGFETALPFDGVLEQTKEQKTGAIETLTDDDGPELSLKYYIDLDRSYPNADGCLVYAKPLYYGMPTAANKNAPALSLVFKDAHAPHFFRQWYDTKNNKAEAYELDVQVQDPTEQGDGIAEPVLEASEKPVTTVAWEASDKRLPLPTDLQMLNTLLQSGEGCVTVNGGKSIVIQAPQEEYLSVETLKLKPNKLYATIFKVKEINANKEKPWQREIHRYNFRTSQYKDLNEHIWSYRKTDLEAQAHRDMVFKLEYDGNLTQLHNIVKGLGSGDANLETAYQDPVDRIAFGLLKQIELPAPVCTEFNFIETTLSPQKKRITALWIKSPEPFNDPKLPPSILEATVKLLGNGKEIPVEKVFSKDGTQVFLMPKKAGDGIPMENLMVSFSYWLFNPKTDHYEPVGDAVITDVLAI